MNPLQKIFKFSDILQIFIYLFVNVLFISKYLSRTSISPILPSVAFVALTIGLLYFYKEYHEKISSNLFKVLSYTLLILFIVVISLTLVYIDPYSIRVDRWSATTFFWDAVFKGVYPYGVHTHVSATNFPSPFPFWQFINLPFYLLGDVGIGLIFFILLAFLALKKYTKNSYKKIFLFLLLLFMSPAYWWEVFVRSDSMSNTVLVFIFILYITSKKYTLNKNFLFIMFCCGLLATTRFSAILPLTLFFFPFYVKLSIKKKFFFLLGIISIFLLLFSPFIFWDTSNWVFFSRNPFMSQTSVGNKYILSVMIIFGVYFSLKWKNMQDFLKFTSIFIFLFIFLSEAALVITKGVNPSFFEDSLYDISYFSLGLVYTILSIVNFNVHDKMITE